MQGLNPGTSLLIGPGEEDLTMETAKSSLRGERGMKGV